MTIVLVTATEMEMQPLRKVLEEIPPAFTVIPLVTGVGMLAACFSLTHRLTGLQPDLVWQLGVAGSFSAQYPPGSLVTVGTEYPGDTGVEENGRFKDIFDLGLLDAGQAPFHGKGLVNPHANWLQRLPYPVVNGVSVNEISTRPGRIAQLQALYQPVTESMEGAALHYVCLQLGLPFLQTRSISNMVGERDKTKWNMAEALAGMGEAVRLLVSGK